MNVCNLRYLQAIPDSDLLSTRHHTCDSLVCHYIDTTENRVIDIEYFSQKIKQTVAVQFCVV